jgi:hypothetical protein
MTPSIVWVKPGTHKDFHGTQTTELRFVSIWFSFEPRQSVDEASKRSAGMAAINQLASPERRRLVTGPGSRTFGSADAQILAQLESTLTRVRSDYDGETLEVPVHHNGAFLLSW